MIAEISTATSSSLTARVPVRPGDIPAHWVAHDIPASPAVLTARWQRSAQAVAALLFATTEGPPPEARLRWAVWELTDTLENVRGRARFVFRASLLLVTWLAPLLVFRLPTLRRLKHEDGLRALERFERSPFGLVLFAVQALLSIVYYEHPEAAASLGFDGGCHGERFDDEGASEDAGEASAMAEEVNL